MALTEEQRALLELLLASGQTYEDIGAVLGEDPGSVRARAAGALEEMRAPAIAADSELTDLALNQLSPNEREAATARVAADPSLADEWRRVSAMLKLLSPGTPPAAAAATPEPSASAGEPAGPAPEPPADDPVEPVKPPVEPADEAAEAERAPAPPEFAEGPTEPEPIRLQVPTLGREQKRLLAGLLGTGLVAMAIVLGVSGVFDGGESSGDAGDTGGETSTSTEATDTSELIRAELQPRGGSEATGAAIFGSAEGSQVPVLQVAAEGLEPTGEDREYIVWLYRNDQFLLRLGGAEVDRSGQMLVQMPVPTEALNYIGDGRLNQIDISLAPRRAYQRELQQAQSQDRIPYHVGESVLRGRIVGPGLAGNAETESEDETAQEEGGG